MLVKRLIFLRGARQVCLNELKPNENPVLRVVPTAAGGTYLA